MSNDTQKADQIAFHFYTKLFYVVNQARATAEPRTQPKADKWFNLETPDSDLFTKEAKEPYKAISLAPPPGPPPLEIQVVLDVPELNNNQVLVYLTSESSRIRIEPTPRFIVLETWTLSFAPRGADEDRSIDVALPTIYKHGIPLFRSLYSLLRVLPLWKLHKRLKRRTQHLSIHLRVRSSHDPDHVIMNFDTPLSPSASAPPLATQVHTFSPVPHPLGSLTLSARYLESPNFQLEELESVLSSRFISQDLGGGEGFVPTLTKNHQRDSSISSSGMRSPPRSVGRTVSSDESAHIAERFILPARTSSAGPPVRNIPQPPRQLASGDFAGNPSPSGLAISRLRKESLGSSPSSSLSIGIPFATTNPSLSSLSSSPSTGPLPIRRPGINPVHPFKSNTVSSAGGSSPSLSIRQSAAGGSPLSTGLAGSHHSRTTSITGRHPPPSPIGVTGHTIASTRPSPPSNLSPSSLDVNRPGTSGSTGSGGSDRDSRRASIGTGIGDSPDEGRAAVPPRKRYASSFGHRYANSVGSVGGSAEGGGGSTSGRSTPAIPGVIPGLGIEIGPRERKESRTGVVSSFMATTTDDDDISIFVQDIDSRKPLSGRWKEREKRDWERLQKQQGGVNLRGSDRDVDLGLDRESAALALRLGPGQSHDREASESSEASTVKPKRYAQHSGSRLSMSPPGSTAPSSRFSTITRTAGLAIPSSSSSTSMPPDHRDEAPSAQASTSPPALSLSPTRGPMLTSQGEVEERLRRMNETFLKSLESFGAGNAAKRKERDQRRKEKERERERSASTTTSTPTSPRKSSTGTTTASGGTTGNGDGDDDAQLAAYAGRGLTIRSPRERQIDDGGAGWKAAALGQPTGPLAYASLGLGLRRSEDNESTSSLGHSDVGAASQGSEEVIGKMDLYEERMRRGYRF